VPWRRLRTGREAEAAHEPAGGTRVAATAGAPARPYYNEFNGRVPRFYESCNEFDKVTCMLITLLSLLYFFFFSNTGVFYCNYKMYQLILF
jgi:hypothetical protein